MSYSSKNIVAASGATQQKLTESVTLRFDKDILDMLKNEAKDKQISLNTLLNQLAI
jgi:uncharacterized protein (DUF4415 family)